MLPTLSCFYRYIPAIEESVIGIITEKFGENVAVDIGGPFTATLPVLAFEGATRRNRPNLQVLGSSAHAITCTDSPLLVQSPQMSNRIHWVQQGHMSHDAAIELQLLCLAAY